MFTKTQILSHYSANKSSDAAALCGRAGHLIKTVPKKKKQIVIISWGSLRVSCKAHMAISWSMCHFGGILGSTGGDWQVWEGWMADSSGQGPVWHCPPLHSAPGTCCGTDTQPQPGGKQWHCSLKKSFTTTPSASDWSVLSISTQHHLQCAFNARGIK